MKKMQTRHKVKIYWQMIECTSLKSGQKVINAIIGRTVLKQWRLLKQCTAYVFEEIQLQSLQNIYGVVFFTLYHSKIIPYVQLLINFCHHNIFLLFYLYFWGKRHSLFYACSKWQTECNRHKQKGWFVSYGDKLGKDNLGQGVGDKFTKLSKKGFSMERFTADFLMGTRHKIQAFRGFYWNFLIS